MFQEPMMDQVVYFDLPDLEINLTCTFNGGVGSDVIVEWIGPAGEELSDNSTVTETEAGIFVSNLTLTNVTTDSSGDYLCTGRYNNSLCGDANITGNANGNASLLVIPSYMPSVTGQTESPFIVEVGRDVDLYFELSSSLPTTDIQCRGPRGYILVEDSTIDNISTRRVDDYDALRTRIEIIVTSVNYTHGGVYSCFANNTAVGINMEILLIVQPSVDVEHILAKNGDYNITIECLAQSSPKPLYIWKKLDVINNTFIALTTYMENNSFLVLEQIHYDDMGIYLCMVKFNDILAVATATFDVTGMYMYCTILLQSNLSTTITIIGAMLRYVLIK